MNNFLGPLRLDYIDGTRWTVIEGFTYRLVQPDGHQYVHIGAGFETDFASFPLGIVFKSPGGKWDKPAVVHDCMYKTAGVSVDGRDDLKPITRGEADAIFKEAMGVAGVNWLAKQIIYAGVRVGGWKAWKRHRRNDGHPVESVG